MDASDSNYVWPPEDLPEPRRSKWKSWSDLRQVVRDVRFQLYSTTCKIPSNVVFSRRAGGGVRVYFLSSVQTGREMTLHYVDVAPNGELSPCRTLFEPKFHSVQSYNKSSKEEQLQLERKRVMMWGITGFDYVEPGEFVFASASSVFRCSDNLPFMSSGMFPEGGGVFPEELKGSTRWTRLDPQMCPHDPTVIAYVANNDLWVYNSTTNTELRLTSVHLHDATMSAGCPCYVTQEEFNRYSGFWWCPVGNIGEGSADVHYTILYEVVDESTVDVVHLPSANTAYGSGVEEYRFPRAGTPNAKSSLRVTTFSLNGGRFTDVYHWSIVNHFLDSAEYVLRANWTPDGRHIWAQLLNRRQDTLQLILVSVTPPTTVEPMETEFPLDDGMITNVTILLEEKSPVWINVHDILKFLTVKEHLELLWASEASGFRHLYLYRMETDGRCLYKRQLTSGDWEVSEKDVWVDQDRRLVYFVALKDTPLEKHLYVISLDDPEYHVGLLTQLGSCHQVFLCARTNLLVAIESSLTQPAFAKVYSLMFPNTNGQAGNTSVLPHTQLIGNLMEPPVVDERYRAPEIFSHKMSSGDMVYGMIFKPRTLDEANPLKFPTVLTIYGGPEVQLVTNNFKGMRHLRHHLLSAEDYCVVTIDCRGSRNRGVAFESHLKGRMGQVEIQDQVEVLQWLAGHKGYIDLNRVAIHGWSYGGYLSLMGLAQRPDVFKVAVAGAPVTQWNLYDTGYTERYMDLPENNKEGYQKGSVLNYVTSFPDQENRLLIIHGLMDENVHFTHTTTLIDALVKAGKPYQLRVYPMERHSLRHLATSEHYETTLLAFLQQFL